MIDRVYLDELGIWNMFCHVAPGAHWDGTVIFGVKDQSWNPN